MTTCCSICAGADAHDRGQATVITDPEVSGRLERAEILLGMKRPHEAGEVATEVVAIAPENGLGWMMLARCYQAIGETPYALHCAERAIGLRPDDPNPHLTASRILRALYRLRESIEAGEEAVRLEPMSASTHANLAIALSSWGEGGGFFWYVPKHVRRARFHAKRAIELAPISTLGHFAAASVAARSNRPKEARSHYRRVLAIDPQDAAAVNNLALVDLKRGRIARSGSGFARALATDPTLSVARRNARKMILAMLGRLHFGAWLVYVAFAGVAGSSKPRGFTVDWTLHASVAVCACALYAALARFIFMRMEPGLRSLAALMVTTRWELRTTAMLDGVIVSCFAISMVAHGPWGFDVYMLGFWAFPVVAFVLGTYASALKHFWRRM
jgi:tetratricopeptide (TPR) repeat protein